MDRILGYDWLFYIGEQNIIFNNQKFIILVGYVGMTTELYIRIFDKERKFIMGDWAHLIMYRDWYGKEDAPINKEIIELCIVEAKVLEELKIFA